MDPYIRNPLGVALVVIIALVLGACGARSGLLEASSIDGGGNGDAATATTGSGSGQRIDAGIPDAALPAPCPDPQWQSPLALITYPDRHAIAPSAVVLDPGDPQTPASVAIQVFASGGNSFEHSAIHVARARIALPWPSGTTLDKPPKLWGVESHGWGEMARASSTTNQLALAWHTDTGGKGRPALRLLDVPSWKPGKLVDIADQGEAVLSLAAGRGVGNHGGYGDVGGYAVAWRDYVQVGKKLHTRPLLAVLSASGKRQIGPFVAAAADGYPGRSPSIIWSGSTYLTATSFSSCVPSDTMCKPSSVVIARVRPPSASTAGDEGALEPVLSIQSLDPSTRPRRAAIVEYSGRVFVAWAEGGSQSEEDEAVFAIRLARLTLEGKLQGQVRLVAKDAQPIHSISLDATSLGLILSWAEEGDSSLPPAQPGSSRIVVHWLDAEGKPLHPVHQLQISRYHNYGGPSAVAIAEPRGLLLTWSGRLEDGYDGTYVSLALCAR